VPQRPTRTGKRFPSTRTDAVDALDEESVTKV